MIVSLRRLREAFGTSRAIDITTDRALRYVKGRLDGGAKPVTVQKELAALKRMFTLAIRARKLTPGQRPYIASLEIHNTRKGFFEASEFSAVLRHLPDHVKPVVEFMYWTGWRTSEVLGLQWYHVDFAHGVVRLEADTTKNDEGRELPFALLPELEEVLIRQQARTEALEKATGQIIPSVFHRDGKPLKCFRGAWARACKAAGLAVMVRHHGKEAAQPLRRPHDFRRTAVRRYERSGVSRSVAMKLTGHKTESVYRRYAIVSPADLREAMAKVAAFHRASEQQLARVTSLGQARPGRTRKVPTKSAPPAGPTAGSHAR
jgi:integrase